MMGRGVSGPIGGRLHVILHPNQDEIRKLYLPAALIVSLRAARPLCVTVTVMHLSVPSSTYFGLYRTDTPAPCYPSVLVNGEGLLTEQVRLGINVICCYILLMSFTTTY